MNTKFLKTLIAGGLILFAAVQLSLAYLSSSEFLVGGRFGYDLELRRNESRCAHQGVNSFRIWTGETSLAGFAPLWRADRATPPAAPGDAIVHAYPPWHTTMFYFYGWLSEWTCRALMFAVFGLCLVFVAHECARLTRARFGDSDLAVGLALALIAFAAVDCLAMLNYGILVLTAFLLMNRALEKGHDVLAGFAWALMMVKPQLGLLFVWPLFWHRHYRTILVAAATCLAATLVTAGLVHESPVDLVLQIPEAGKPYGTGGITRILGEPLFGRHATAAVMAAFFVLTGVATGFFRKNRDFLVCCVPAVLVIPVWTYNKLHDGMILLPAFIILAGRIFSARRFGRWAAVGCAYAVAATLVYGWAAATEIELVGEALADRVRPILKLLSLVPLFALFVLLALDEWKKGGENDETPPQERKRGLSALTRWKRSLSASTRWKRSLSALTRWKRSLSASIIRKVTSFIEAVRHRFHFRQGGSFTYCQGGDFTYCQGGGFTHFCQGGSGFAHFCQGGSFTHFCQNGGVRAAVVVGGLFLLLHLADVFGRGALPWGDYPWLLDPRFSSLKAFLLPVRDVVCWTLLAAAPVFLLGGWARLVLIPGFCVAAVLETSVVYTYATNHVSLAEIWPTVFLNSSAEEVRAFLKMSLTPGVVALLVAFLLALSVGVVALAKARYPRVTRRSFALGLALLLPFVVLELGVEETKYGIRTTLYSDFVVRSALTWTRLKGIGQACSGNPQLPATLTSAAADAARPNVVIVLGESMSRRYWHLYGYPRQTTPRTDALCREGGGICYRDLVCVYGETTEAVCTLLSDVSADNPTVGHWTLAEVFQRAGWRGTLITNQFLWKFEKDLLLARIFNGCAERVNAAEAFPGDAKVYDERTAELLARVLRRETPEPQLVFVHLAGAHFPVENANPASENHFTDAVEGEALAGLSPEARDRANRYDNAVRYEDKVLGMLVDVVKAESRRPACLVYLSDHGESPRAPFWRDYADDGIYEVPCVLWFSESYRAAFPAVVEAARRAATRPLQSDELTYGLVELGRVTGLPNVRPEQSFLHPDFKPRAPRKVDKGRRVYTEGPRP